VDLPNGIGYRLGDDLSLGRVGIGSDEGDYVLIRDLTLGEFLRLCARIPFNDLFVIGCDVFMAQDALEQRRARARLGRARSLPNPPAPSELACDQQIRAALQPDFTVAAEQHPSDRRLT
jgi:hypothetical protein